MQKSFKEIFFHGSDNPINKEDFEKILDVMYDNSYKNVIDFMTPSEGLTFNYVQKIYNKTTKNPIDEIRFHKLLNVFDTITRHGYFVNNDNAVPTIINKLKNEPCKYTNYLVRRNEFLFAIVISIDINNVKIYGINYDLDNDEFIFALDGETYRFETYDELINFIINLNVKKSTYRCKKSDYKFI